MDAAPAGVRVLAAAGARAGASPGSLGPAPAGKTLGAALAPGTALAPGAALAAPEGLALFVAVGDWGAFASLGNDAEGADADDQTVAVADGALFEALPFDCCPSAGMTAMSNASIADHKALMSLI